MAENSKIEWTHHTFNPWIGCTKISAGCDNCYAEADFDKRRHIVQWGTGQPRKRTAPSTWAQPVKWNAEAERLGVRYRVFCASLADVFDNEVPDEWRRDLFALISATPHLDWLLVTKRIGNAKTMMADALHLNPAAISDGRIWPLPNIWIGATVTNQAEADRDIPKLLAVPAAVRFLSMEPLLGSVDLQSAINLMPWRIGGGDAELHWVIVGGESGPNARPMHPAWARSLRDQCAEAGVPFLFKQWGEWETGYQRSDGVPVFRQFENFEQWVAKAASWVNGGICLDRHGKQLNRGADMAEARDTKAFPVTIMHRVGKKAAGRLLDGVLHDGYPEVPQA